MRTLYNVKKAKHTGGVAGLCPFGLGAARWHSGGPMRRLRVALPVIVLAGVVGTSARWAATAPEPKPTFRVATWNIHKGADRRGTYDLEQTIDAIARFDADLVSPPQVMRNQLESNCDDQPALIADGLRRRTGRPWTEVHVKAWTSDKR